MNYLLSISSEQYAEKLGAADSLEFGGQMVLLGMGAVFSVLTLIWLVLTIFKLVFTKINAPEKKAEAPAPVAPSAPVTAPVTSDAEIVAVIAAAIAMAQSECGDDVKFRVVSFKRK